MLAGRGLLVLARRRATAPWSATWAFRLRAPPASLRLPDVGAFSGGLPHSLALNPPDAVAAAALGFEHSRFTGKKPAAVQFQDQTAAYYYVALGLMLAAHPAFDGRHSAAPASEHT